MNSTSISVPAISVLASPGALKTYCLIIDLAQRLSLMESRQVDGRSLIGVPASRSDLAAWCGIGVSTLNRHLAELRSMNLLEVQHRFDDQGGQLPSIYWAVVG